MAVVEARGLTKRFGGLLAVDRLDLAIEGGTCFGFLGPNGAGKTSTMRMIGGTSPPTAGELRVFGLDVASRRAEIKRRLGVVPQENNLDDELTVRQNLLTHARFYRVLGAEAERRADALLAFLELGHRAQDWVHALSGGMKRRLLIARALMHRPELLILDEPTTGLDPQARQLVWGKLQELQRGGTTMLLTTHYMDEAEALCDLLVILDHGRVIAQGAPRALIGRHIGREVLELEVPAARHDDVLSAVSGLAAGHEALGDRLILHGPDAEALLRAVEAHKLPLSGAHLRRATLEDVFLKLAGRRLGEE
ncbi:MAG TPA: ABC transporter ATP-binding protein [Candidatus Thermoplasmatota archaeon]|nr:ABC transporter ATP-binding protein [Candidatus Thermoplasmatota archaeon]